MNESVLLPLSHDEALVFFEFLSRFNDEQNLEIKDAAERRVLCNMLCGLERTLAEPLRSDYFALLQGARDRVRELNG